MPTWSASSWLPAHPWWTASPSQGTGTRSGTSCTGEYRKMRFMSSCGHKWNMQYISKCFFLMSPLLGIRFCKHYKNVLILFFNFCCVFTYAFLYEWYFIGLYISLQLFLNHLHLLWPSPILFFPKYLSKKFPFKFLFSIPSPILFFLAHFFPPYTFSFTFYLLSSKSPWFETVLSPILWS